LAVALIVAGCSSSSGSSASTTSTMARPTGAGKSLAGPTWVLRDPGALGAGGADAVVTARFDAGTVGGSAGCNRYTGSYRLDGSRLSISTNLATTQMACAPDLAAVERAYLDRLGQVARYAIDDGVLTLSDSRGRARLRYTSSTGAAALAGRWQVVMLYTGDAVQSPEPGSTITAEFGDGTVQGNGGCNQYSGPFRVSADTISIGPLQATKMACMTAALTTQEQHYLDALQGARTYAVAGPRLELFRADGGTAVLFERDPTSG